MLDGLGFFLRVRRLWSLSYRMSPQSKMRCKAKKTVGVIRKTAARTMIISRSSFTNSNMEPKNRKQKAQAAAIRPQRMRRWTVKGLHTWYKTRRPVRLIRAAETVYSCSVGKSNTKTKPTAMRTTMRLVKPPGNAFAQNAGHEPSLNSLVVAFQGQEKGGGADGETADHAQVQGHDGIGKVANMEMSASRREKMFFTRNRAAAL